MKARIKDFALSFDKSQTLTLSITNGDFRQEFDRFKDKDLSVEIKLYREKRSLNANAYAWVLMSKIAEVIGSTKDEVYLEELQKYGVFTHVIVKEIAVERVIETWRTVVNLGKVTVNGQTGIQLQCYYGSSTFNTKEMATFIDGIVSDAKELEIETETPEELARIKEEWGR